LLPPSIFGVFLDFYSLRQQKKSAGKAEMTVTSVEVTVEIIVTTIYLLEKANAAVTTAILLKDTTIQGES